MSYDQYYEIVIGIDFGVDFTGACYSFKYIYHEKPEFYNVTDWSRKGYRYNPKTPTVSKYKKANDEYHLSGWGYGAESSIFETDSICLSRFDLLLDSKPGAEHELVDGLPLKKVIADYLKLMVNDVKKCIRRKVNPLLELTDSPHYCLTLPITCTDTAKSNIRQAAVDAGLVTSNDSHEKLVIIGKPEAAAVACAFEKAETLKYGDVIFVCDADDNTIDLVAYKVYYKEGKKYFEELTRAQSKSWGFGCIDKLARLWFQAHLENVLGVDSIKSYELDWMTDDRRFGPIKDSFWINDDDDDDDDDDSDFDFDFDDVRFVHLPTSLAKRIDKDNEIQFLQDNKFKITHAEAKEFLFDPVANEVLNMISERLDHISNVQPEKINLFLLGGFGQSKYLHEKIKENFVDTRRIGSVFLPKGDGLTIARGAVLYGLDPFVITDHVSRRSYGVRCNRSYREGIDKPKYLIIGRDGKRRCKNRIDFLIKKGTPIAKNHYTEREYYALYPDNLKYTLYAYDADGELPDYVTDEGIEAVSKLDITMPEIPGKKANEKIKYKTKIYFGVTEIKIKVEICGQSQTYLVNLDENNANNAQAMTEKEHKLPGFDSMINYFKRLGYQTDHYRNCFQIPSPEVKVGRRPIETIKKQLPVVVSGDGPSIYFDANPNPPMLPELP